MFVRFRQSRQRLQTSLIETRRTDGRVRHEHIASLGAVDIPPSIRERFAFWGKLPGRLAKLDNRVNAEDQQRIYGTIHAHIPMVTPDEQRLLQEENAEADEKFWTALRDMNASNVEDHKDLAKTVEEAIAGATAMMAEADAKAAAAKERRERLKRGENVAGGLGKPMTRQDFMKMVGWTASDAQHAELLNAIHQASGWEILTEIKRRQRLAEKSAARVVADALIAISERLED